MEESMLHKGEEHLECSISGVYYRGFYGGLIETNVIQWTRIANSKIKKDGKK